MSSITIHEIDPLLDQRLSQVARERHTSKNRLVKDLLASGLGLALPAGGQNDYEEFCGVWTAAELTEFTASQAGNVSLDPSDWQ